MFSETAKVSFKILHNSLAIILLGIISIFMYEKNFMTFEDFLSIYAVIPSNVKFGSSDPISFFILSDTAETSDVKLIKILSCDYGDGNGFGIVSSQISELDITTHDEKVNNFAEVNINNINNSNNIENTDNATFVGNSPHRKLYELMKTTNISDYITYDSNLPSRQSQCIIKFKFAKFTRNFHIEKNFEVTSYPFEYVPQAQLDLK